jgi:hypothetical protein
MLWTKNVNLNIIGNNDNMIDCYVDCGNIDISWRATGVYGFPKHQQKTLTCDLISNLNQNNSHENWLLFCDLNLILNPSEKQGGRNIHHNIIDLANNTLNECNLVDLGYHGDPFTWSNNQENEHHIKERLDRFCATPSWITRFPRFTNYHIPNYNSDHTPILLVFGTNHDFREDTHFKNHLKRFENIWLQDKECLQIVKTVWSNRNEDLKENLQEVLTRLHQWGKTNYGNVPKEIRSTQDMLNNLRTRIPTWEDLNHIKQLETKLDNLHQKEEQWWAQRAKTKWLQQGDKNSKYFHFKATQRQRKNKINFINNSQGVSLTQNKDIQDVFLNYFIDMFTSTNPSNMQDSLQVVAGRLHSQMYDYLNKDFSAAEISHAAHQLSNNVAPSPDGLNARFYQAHWDIIGEDIVQTTLHILNNGGNPVNFNDTYICLIPKHNNPTTPADFRPISLCNVILKIITKTIANRIKEILPEVISPQQSAFLPGRLITDNTLLAFETFHYLKHNKNKKKGYVGIKLDMAKAYDRLEWSFIENTLLTMGFPSKLVQTIMLCVSTVSFFVLVNGHPSLSFKPHRGIMQRDPLSPYLFILCADVFSGLLTKNQDQYNINGIKIAQNAPKVSHLFFADDSLIFCKSNKSEADHLLRVFEEYQRISGQKINMEKSEMTFSPHIQQHIKEEFHAILPFSITNNISKYLGMPTQIGQSRHSSFNFIMDKIRNKLKGWKERHLSYAGRGILISAVIQALPTYLMSCFLLPKSLCDQIEQVMCRFWWGSRDRQQKIHWKSKKAIFKSKLVGGLGFRDMHLFNKALLAKQVWRLQTNPDSLLGQCLKAKYYPNSAILHAPIHRNASYAWQSIYQAINIIKKGSCWKVGNGYSINIWDDNWVLWQNGYRILSTHNDQLNINRVSDIISESPTKSWDARIIDQNFLPFESSLIKQTPLIMEQNEDQLMWPHSKDGDYSVKSGYNLLCQWHNDSLPGSAHNNNQDKTWKKLWSLNTILRHKVLLWRIIQNDVPVRSELSKRGVPCTILCPRCLLKEETLDHTFMKCQYVAKIWFGSKLGISFDQSHFNISDWFIYALNNFKEEDLMYMAAITYGIWFVRNLKIFEDTDMVEDQVINNAAKSIQEYQLAT